MSEGIEIDVDYLVAATGLSEDVVLAFLQGKDEVADKHRAKLDHAVRVLLATAETKGPEIPEELAALFDFAAHCNHPRELDRDVFFAALKCGRAISQEQLAAILVHYLHMMQVVVERGLVAPGFAGRRSNLMILFYAQLVRNQRAEARAVWRKIHGIPEEWVEGITSRLDAAFADMEQSN